MGSVISKSRFPREKKIHLAIFAIYFVAAFAFFTFGLQPTKNPAAVYAAESEHATHSLQIDVINLSTPVAEVSLDGSDLVVPDQIAGAYSAHPNKTLLIGHSSTIFTNLHNLSVSDIIKYDGKAYTITTVEEKLKSDISMKDILKEEPADTVVLMTCSGELIAGTNGDHTHRLIITATSINPVSILTD